MRSGGKGVRGKQEAELKYKYGILLEKIHDIACLNLEMSVFIDLKGHKSPRYYTYKKADVETDFCRRF